MRKRLSLRRWKARCRLGRSIPAYAIVDHRLDRWFNFKAANVNMDTWHAFHPMFYNIARKTVGQAMPDDRLVFTCEEYNA
jgi:hypothetical protein